MKRRRDEKEKKRNRKKEYIDEEGENGEVFSNKGRGEGRSE